MTDIQVEGAQVKIGQETHEFDENIDDHAVINDIVAVILSVPNDEVNNRNIIGFGTDGSRQWRVESLYSGDDDIPYVYIDTKDGKLIADTWTGVRVTIEPNTGEIIDTKFMK
ncbi:hypothetical protein HLRTI_001685 [Halorhabdus tiamatea SARL4B]|uniref:Uncharacterized protein n=1 Tax=Halorhabdus tiamatea SARL4B TaxID=1033806 RepID=U2E2K3_9EURY|nr:hypothetical protein [Halorhabdus tiamatea]ERJ06206.1 hypothetical protein HLRTI_001685 [Halorhabdus tiamatea SARL4B]